MSTKIANSSPTLLIIGVGLLGGSFGLALKQRGFAGIVRGLDRDDVLAAARRRGAIDEGTTDLGAACAGADLILLATPVGAILDLIPKLAAAASPEALIGDTGSTKLRIAESGARCLGERFLGGHPMAGRERGGIEHADADLFAGRRWLLCPVEAPAAGVAATPALRHWSDVVGLAGAAPLILAADVHDRALAWLSHVPQLLSTALAAELDQQFGEDPDRTLLAAAGPGVRDMTRLAGSSYALWRDILLTNSEPIDRALARMEQAIAHLRLHLRDREAEKLFRDAAALYDELRRGIKET